VPRTVLNLLVVWLLTGLWHGADWNFLLWGFYYFALLVAEKLFLGKALRRAPKFIARAYALVFIVIGWLIFYFKSAQGGFDALLDYLGGMLGFATLPLWNGEFIYEITRNLALLLIFVVGCTPFPKRIFEKIIARAKATRCATPVLLLFDILTVLLFVLCIVYISSSDYRPNIYFEF
jgi:alginate O-acetyltransferase complex protein AlgI